MKPLDWKIAVAGGTVIGVGIGGFVLADAGEPSTVPDGVDLLPPAARVASASPVADIDDLVDEIRRLVDAIEPDPSSAPTGVPATVAPPPARPASAGSPPPPTTAPPKPVRPPASAPGSAGSAASPVPTPPPPAPPPAPAPAPAAASASVASPAPAPPPAPADSPASPASVASPPSPGSGGGAST
jgi:hypothetical protein